MVYKWHLMAFNGIYYDIPSGYVKIAIEYMAQSKIVDLPTNSMVIFHSYVSLPEGNPYNYGHRPTD